MPEIKTYICPSCNRTILHEVRGEKDDASSSETCSCCGRTWTVKELENAFASGAVGGATQESHPAEDILAYSDDAESALAYLENFYETYDWAAFNRTSSLGVPAVERMVEKTLVRSAAKPATWELKFTAVSRPIFKKLNGLKELEKKFLDVYVQQEDLSAAYPYLDNYRLIAKKIVEKRDEILKDLSSAIKYYGKYAGSPAVAEQMKAQYESLESQLKAVKLVKSYKDLPGYPEAQAEKQRLTVKKLAAKGIDAEAVFSKAVADYGSGADRRRVLASFQRLSGYKNASEYAEEIDAHMSIEIKSQGVREGLFVRLGKKHYFFREDAPQTFKVEETKSGCFNKLFKKNKAEPAEPTPEPVEDIGKTRYSLHEIVGKKVQKDPVVSGITEILTQYAGYLVYIKNDSALCTFNSNAANAASAETVVRESKRGAFDNPGKKTNCFRIGSHLYLLEKLETTALVKQGCFAKLLHKEQQVRITTKNNYALLDLDLETGLVKTAVSELIDIMDTFGSEIFYAVVKMAEQPPKQGCFKKLFGKKKEEKPEDKRAFLVYDAATGKSREILSEDTEIVDVVDGKVIYFVWTPNEFNKDLCTFDLATNKQTVLVKNVYDYFRSIDGKLYYFVGSASYKTLYSIRVDGTEKKEILRKAGYLGSAVERNGWIFLEVGKGLNAALVKISMETGERVVVCAQFKKLIKLRDGYVYYLDTLNGLRVVREDGTENKIILDAVGEIVSVGEESVYLLRNEYAGIVDCSLQERNSRSLYKVSLEGAALEKLYFDVNSAILNDSDEEEIYLYTVHTKEFKITTPTSAKNETTANERRTIKTLSLFNTATGKTEEVAILGRPESDPATFKKGCFKKKSLQRDVKVEEVAFKRSYIRTGKMQAGAMNDEQLEERKADEEKK